MARFVGLDIGARYVRAALLTTGYRRVSVERLEEAPLTDPEFALETVRAVVAPLMQQVDGISAAVDGDQAFVHRLELPSTAAKQLSEVLHFEIESQVPVDLDELVYDHRVLPRAPGRETVSVLVAAARTQHVKDKIELVRNATGREPERVACGSMVVANLASVSTTLRGPGPLAMVDLGGTRTGITLIERGEPVFVRTLSRGTEGLPDNAGELVAELRQSLFAWALRGGAPVQAMYLLGGGAFSEGADRFFSHELGVEVLPLPALEVGALPDVAAALPRFAKAVALALGAAGRSHDINLRQGSLSFQRGFGFLKEKAPLLLGLGAATLVSFAFASWAEARALSRENAVLSERLGALSKEVLGTEATDAETATQLLEKARTPDEPDPVPQMDAFDVIVEISKTVPTTVTHDIEEFDMQRGHVKVQGVAGTATEAQNIAADLAKNKCLSEAKISKVSAQVNSDRQKYVLDVDVRCPDDKKKPPPKKKAEDGSDNKQEGAAP